MNLYIYDSSTINFDNRGLGSLSQCPRAVVTEEINGEYYLEFAYSHTGRNAELIKNERIIKASTPHGWQLFRINCIDKTLDEIKVHANHIFYDLLDNFIEDTNIVNKTGDTGIKQLLSKCKEPHSFVASSNIPAAFNCRIVRKNPVEAILGDEDNSLINRVGGEIERDNFIIRWNQRLGTDRGFAIKYRKNLVGIDFLEDMTGVVTRIVPIGFDGLLLPEMYVDSPNVHVYNQPKIRKVPFEDVISNKLSPDHEDAIPHDKAIKELRKRAIKMFELGLDAPKIRCEINFVDLSTTEEYKHYKHLQKVMIGDDVAVVASSPNITLTKRVTQYTWDALLEAYESIVLSELNISGFNQGFKKEVNAIVNANLEPIYLGLKTVQISADGKNRIYRSAEEPVMGSLNDIWYKPVGDGEIIMYIHDGITWKVEKVSTGLLKGTINASSGDVNIINLNANNITAGTIFGGSSFWNLDTEEFNIGGHLMFNPATGFKVSQEVKSQLKGEDGKGVRYVKPERAESISATVPPVEGWGDGATQTADNYVWERLKIVYTDGTNSYTDPYLLPSGLKLSSYEEAINAINTSIANVTAQISTATGKTKQELLNKLDELRLALNSTIEDKDKIIKNELNAKITKNYDDIQTQMTTNIEAAQESIILKVGEEYQLKTDAAELIKSVTTQMEQTNEAFTFKFDEFIQDLDAVKSDTEAQFIDIKKYIRFKDGIIQIGEENNEISSEYTKDGLEIKYNDVVVAKFSKETTLVKTLKAERQMMLGDKWAIRLGAYREGYGNNLDIVWLG